MANQRILLVGGSGYIGTPLAKSLEKDGYKVYITSRSGNYLSDSRIVEDNWINQDWISKYINQNNLDVSYVNKFFGLLAFEIWYRLFITKEMKSDTILN